MLITQREPARCSPLSTALTSTLIGKKSDRPPNTNDGNSNTNNINNNNNNNDNKKSTS